MRLAHPRQPIYIMFISLVGTVWCRVWLGGGGRRVAWLRSTCLQDLNRSFQVKENTGRHKRKCTSVRHEGRRRILEERERQRKTERQSEWEGHRRVQHEINVSVTKSGRVREFRAGVGGMEGGRERLDWSLILKHSPGL